MAMREEIEEERAYVTEEDAEQVEESLREIADEVEEEEEVVVIAETPGQKEMKKQTKPLPPDTIIVYKEPAAAVSQIGIGGGANISTDRWTNLKINVANQASTNTARLRALLETAPESAKPALKKAIYNLEANYRKAIESLNEP